MPRDRDPFTGGFVYLLGTRGGDRVLTIREWGESVNEPVRTSGGVPVTDELCDCLAGEAEAGYDLDRLTPRRRSVA